MTHAARFPLAMLCVVAPVALWSVIRPHDYFTWMLETLPVFIALAVLTLSFRRFPLTQLAYALIALHSVVLLVGGHYTYAEVPLFNWLRDEFGLARNHYDRVGHFVQGLGPAIIARELLLRTSPLKQGKWLCAIIIFCCLGISACYELIEWLAAETTGDAASAFLGTQGDGWDTQKDMALALAGAFASLMFLARLHDRELARLGILP